MCLTAPHHSHTFTTAPPLPPNITVLPAARFVTVSWSTPSSLLPITNYRVNISESLSGAVTIETIAADTLYYNATSLTPNLQYNVSVVALNRAGASSVTTEPFYTLEDGTDLIIHVHCTLLVNSSYLSCLYSKVRMYCRFQ